jgi:hypothetical protein
MTHIQVHGITEEVLDADTRALQEAKKTAVIKQHREIAAARDICGKKQTFSNS